MQTQIKLLQNTDQSRSNLPFLQKTIGPHQLVKWMYSIFIIGIAEYIGK